MQLATSWLEADLSTLVQSRVSCCGHLAKPDVVFVPTVRNHPVELDERMSCVSLGSHLDTPVIYLTGAGEGVFHCRSGLSTWLPDEEFLNFCSGLYTPKTSIGSAYLSWNLPIKRQYAVWYALKEGHVTALLIDDDIYDVSSSDVEAGVSSTLHNKGPGIVGFTVDEEFDTSAIGALNQKYVRKRLPWLSGSCLLVNLEKARPFFPPIYNEDWLALLASRESGLAIGGVAKQRERSYLLSFSLSRWQESGEIFADTLLQDSVKCISSGFPWGGCQPQV